MNFWDFSRSPASVKLLVDFGKTQGLQPAKVLTGSRLTLAQLNGAEVTVSPGQELQVISNLLGLTAHPAGLGLQVGLNYHLSAYGILGYGLMSSTTGADALALGRRFLPLTYAFTTIAHRQEGEYDLLQFEAPADLAPVLQRFVVERAMAATSRLLLDVIGNDFVLAAFKLQYPGIPKNTASTLSRILGARIQFSAEANLLSFRHAYLVRKLPQANPITAAMCERMCTELIDRRRTGLRTATFIQEYLNSLPGNNLPDLQDIARLLNTSDRTLKRWLQKEGTSFRQLLATTHHAKADALLADGRLSLSEVAEALGFSDLSTFSQAYKRWTGVAPSLARKSFVSEG